MTGGWWRRNAVSLVAVAVLLPVTIGVVAANEWSSFGAERATKPVSAQPGDAVAYGGATIGPAKAEIVADASAPRGSNVVSATVLVTPGDEPISCLTPTLHETDGAQRQWNEASFDLDLDVSADQKTVCDSELRIRYSLTLFYIVPDDATGPFAIELEAADALPQFARLVVEP
jgi:hypothetical protein